MIATKKVNTIQPVHKLCTWKGASWAFYTICSCKFYCEMQCPPILPALISCLKSVGDYMSAAQHAWGTLQRYLRLAAEEAACVSRSGFGGSTIKQGDTVNPQWTYQVDEPLQSHPLHMPETTKRKIERVLKEHQARMSTESADIQSPRV